MPKIIVVGFDGATWDIINPLIAHGALPAFETLMNESTWGSMESTMPPMTIPAWISMFSGLTPEQLGLFDFNKVIVGKKAVETRLVNSSDCSGSLLWDILSRRTMKSLVLNIPGTYPPYPIEGHLIGLDFTPLERCTYPFELEQLLTEKHNLALIRENQHQFLKGGKAALDMIRKEETMVLDVAMSFCRAYEYDIAVVRFGIPDHVSHHSLDENVMRECHFFMDNLLQHIREIPCEYLILVSDHGIKKGEKLFHINTYLEDMGFFSMGTRERLREFGDKAIITLGKRVVGETKRLGTEHRDFTSMETIQRKKSAAFAYSAIPTQFCPLYITDNSAREAIVQRLKQCEYVKNIHDVKCQDGPAALVESSCQIAARPGKAHIGYQPRWYHDMKGIFLIQGKDVRKGHHIDCSIYDIAPTLLHMLGVAIPDGLTGRILEEAFEESSEIRKRIPQYAKASAHERNEEERVKDSIRILGKLGRL